MSTSAFFPDNQGLGQLGELNIHFQFPGHGVGLFIQADHFTLKHPARTQYDLGRLSLPQLGDLGFIDPGGYPDLVQIHHLKDGGAGGDGIADFRLAHRDQAVHGGHNVAYSYEAPRPRGLPIPPA